MAKKKVTEANLDFWLGERTQNIRNIHNLSEEDVQQRPTRNLDVILTALGQQRTFVQLQRYISANPIPDCNYVLNSILTQVEVEFLDMMPNDMPPGLAPLQVEGDGNCFPCTISYMLFKSEHHHTEIHVRIIYEAVLNMEMYMDHNYISNGAYNFYDHGTLPEQYAQ